MMEMENRTCSSKSEELNNTFDHLVPMWCRRYTKLVRNHNTPDSTPKVKSKTSRDVGLNHHKNKSTPLPVQTVRDIPDLMIIICSFLTVSDRVHLGEVDTQFYLHPARGTIVGIYGEDDLEFDETLKVVKNWILYEGSPESWGAEGVELNPPGGYVLDDFDKSWRYWDFFDKIHGFNIAEIQEWVIKEKSSFQIKNFDQDEFINALIHIDKERKSRIAKIDLICNNKPEHPAPPRAIFDMMKDVGLDGERFQWDISIPDFFHIITPSEDAQWQESTNGMKWVTSELTSLQSRQKIQFQDIDGMKSANFHRCEWCREWRMDSKIIYCENCLNKYVCNACYGRKCSTCGKVDCHCRFEKCSAPDCKNYVCCYFLHDEPRTQCAFFPLQGESLSLEEQYCRMHKPKISAQIIDCTAEKITHRLILD